VPLPRGADGSVKPKTTTTLVHRVNKARTPRRETYRPTYDRCWSYVLHSKLHHPDDRNCATVPQCDATSSTSRAPDAVPDGWRLPRPTGSSTTTVHYPRARRCSTTAKRRSRLPNPSRTFPGYVLHSKPRHPDDRNIYPQLMLHFVHRQNPEHRPAAQGHRLTRALCFHQQPVRRRPNATPYLQPLDVRAPDAVPDGWRLPRPTGPSTTTVVRIHVSRPQDSTGCRDSTNES
jgi:hypothetical protein